MTDSPLLVDRHDTGVAVLTLNLPDRRNAMVGELTEAWTQTIASLKTDPSVRCVVVTGAGTAFCAGGDLSWLGESPDLGVDAIRDRMVPFYRAWLSIRGLEVPSIAAINGAAVGAGLCLALACDLRYATPTAKLSVPFTQLGMHPGMAATYLLPEAVGLPVAKELFLTGRAVVGDEAVRIGLINKICEPENLLHDAVETATKIAAAAPVATKLLIAGLRTGAKTSIDEALEYEGLAQPVTFGMRDLTEGLAAAKERRPATWTGR